MKAMTLKWHPEASGDLNAILVYCSTTFGRKTARDVRDKLLSTARLLCTNPSLGSIEPLLKSCTTLEYRSLVVNSYTKIIYTIHIGYIYIHLLWDVRQDEKRISKIVTDRYKLSDVGYTNMLNEPAIPYGSGVEE